MNQFCVDTMEFLRSEYSDAYEYAMEVTHNMFSEPTAELTIQISKGYTVKVPNNSMSYLYSLYKTGTFIQERGQYEWQKELVDMIEGG